MMLLEYPGLEEPIPVYVSNQGGVLRCMIRATDRATYLAQGEAVGLLVRHERQVKTADAVYSYTDTGEVNDLGPIIEATLVTPEVWETEVTHTPASGVDIHEVGEVTLTPGTYDEDGVEITPPVVDTRWHVNFWLSPARVEAGAWEEWAVAWTAYGEPAAANAAEQALAFQGVELIDPDTVTSPDNRML